MCVVFRSYYYWCGEQGDARGHQRSTLLSGLLLLLYVTNLHIKPWQALSPVPTLTSARGLHSGNPVFLKLWTFPPSPKHVPFSVNSCPISQSTNALTPNKWVLPILEKNHRNESKGVHIFLSGISCSALCLWNSTCLTCLLLIPFYQWLLFHCKNIIVVYFFSAFG